ncbi:unnamed protein product [Amoebophrya sp. A120]|nr:unnamed protein product [Amoebophrya sp. A120]|eukprot:GSA120T00002481001.1
MVPDTGELPGLLHQVAPPPPPLEDEFFPSHVICHQDVSNNKRPKASWNTCWDFVKKGWCPRGAKCPWEHVASPDADQVDVAENDGGGVGAGGGPTTGGKAVRKGAKAAGKGGAKMLGGCQKGKAMKPSGDPAMLFGHNTKNYSGPFSTALDEQPNILLPHKNASSGKGKGAGPFVVTTPSYCSPDACYAKGPSPAFYDSKSLWSSRFGDSGWKAKQPQKGKGGKVWNGSYGRYRSKSFSGRKGENGKWSIREYDHGASAQRSNGDVEGAEADHELAVVRPVPTGPIPTGDDLEKKRRKQSRKVKTSAEDKTNKRTKGGKRDAAEKDADDSGEEKVRGASAETRGDHQKKKKKKSTAGFPPSRSDASTSQDPEEEHPLTSKSTTKQGSASDVTAGSSTKPVVSVTAAASGVQDEELGASKLLASAKRGKSKSKAKKTLDQNNQQMKRSLSEKRERKTKIASTPKSKEGKEQANLCAGPAFLEQSTQAAEQKDASTVTAVVPVVANKGTLGGSPRQGRESSAVQSSVEQKPLSETKKTLALALAYQQNKRPGGDMTLIHHKGAAAAQYAHYQQQMMKGNGKGARFHPGAMMMHPGAMMMHPGMVPPFAAPSPYGYWMPPGAFAGPPSYGPGQRSRFVGPVSGPLAGVVGKGAGSAVAPQSPPNSTGPSAAVSTGPEGSSSGSTGAEPQQLGLVPYTGGPPSNGAGNNNPMIMRAGPGGADVHGYPAFCRYGYNPAAYYNYNARNYYAQFGTSMGYYPASRHISPYAGAAAYQHSHYRGLSHRGAAATSGIIPSRSRLRAGSDSCLQAGTGIMRYDRGRRRDSTVSKTRLGSKELVTLPSQMTNKSTRPHHPIPARVRLEAKRRFQRDLVRLQRTAMGEKSATTAKAQGGMEEDVNVKDIRTSTTAAAQVAPMTDADRNDKNASGPATSAALEIELPNKMSLVMSPSRAKEAGAEEKQRSEDVTASLSADGTSPTAAENIMKTGTDDRSKSCVGAGARADSRTTHFDQRANELYPTQHWQSRNRGQWWPPPHNAGMWAPYYGHYDPYRYPPSFSYGGRRTRESFSGKHLPTHTQRSAAGSTQEGGSEVNKTVVATPAATGDVVDTKLQQEQQQDLRSRSVTPKMSKNLIADAVAAAADDDDVCTTGDIKPTAASEKEQISILSGRAVKRISPADSSRTSKIMHAGRTCTSEAIRKAWRASSPSPAVKIVPNNDDEGAVETGLSLNDNEPSALGAVKQDPLLPSAAGLLDFGSVEVVQVKELSTTPTNAWSGRSKVPGAAAYSAKVKSNFGAQKELQQDVVSAPAPSRTFFADSQPATVDLHNKARGRVLDKEQVEEDQEVDELQDDRMCSKNDVFGFDSPPRPKELSTTPSKLLSTRADLDTTLDVTTIKKLNDSTSLLSSPDLVLDTPTLQEDEELFGKVGGREAVGDRVHNNIAVEASKAAGGVVVVEKDLQQNTDVEECSDAGEDHLSTMKQTGAPALLATDHPRSGSQHRSGPRGPVVARMGGSSTNGTSASTSNAALQQAQRQVGGEHYYGRGPRVGTSHHYDMWGHPPPGAYGPSENYFPMHAFYYHPAAYDSWYHGYHYNYYAYNPHQFAPGSFRPPMRGDRRAAVTTAASERNGDNESGAAAGTETAVASSAEMDEQVLRAEQDSKPENSHEEEFSDKRAVKDCVNAAVAEVLAKGSAVLEADDFDFRVMRFLYGLCANRGEGKLQECMASIEKVVQNRTRADVSNWSAYLSSLLKKFDPNLFPH